MVDVTARIKVRRLHPCQQTIYAARKRFNVIRCGRRFGKTTFCQRILFHDKGWGMFDGYPVAWYAGKQDTFDEVWTETKLLLEQIDKDVGGGFITIRDGSLHHIRICNGGSVRFYSLHNGDDGGIGRGKKFRRLVVDEAAHAKDLLRCWNRVMRLCLIDYRGDAYFPSTPNGRNDFYELDQRSKDPAQRNKWASFHATSFDNPYLPQSELEDLLAEYSGRPQDYQQEVMAEYITEVGRVFDTKWIKFLELPEVGGIFPRRYQAWDLAVTEEALQRGDHSVGVCGALDAHNRFWALDMVRGRWNAAEVVEQIIRFRHKHQACKVWFEGGPIGRAVEPFLKLRMDDQGAWFQYETITPTRDKVTRAQPLVGIMANGRFHVPRPVPQWYHEMDRELVEFPPDEKGTDDIVDAWAHLASRTAEWAKNAPPPPTVAEVEQAVRGMDLKRYREQVAKLAAKQAKKGRKSKRGRR